MTAEALKAIEVLGEVSEGSINPNEQNKPEPPEMDEFGRTADERTIELESSDAELVNTEVEDGRHKTYADALHYVLGRGFAEIKRTREAARKLAEKTLLQAKRDNWSKMLASNPALIQNQELLTAMCRELGILPQSK